MSSPQASGLKVLEDQTISEGHELESQQKFHGAEPCTRQDSGIDQLSDVANKYGLSRTRRYVLLGVLCLGVFMDVLGVCVFYILTGPVSRDLDIEYTQSTWVITSYGITFAAFLLFWGRVSDLYSAKPVFCWGSLALAVLSLIISFMTDKYSFLVLRALSGISAACSIPASYRLITAFFDRHELPRAFTIYTLSGSIGASLGVLLAGGVELIKADGQLSGWRWYFRITCLIVLPMAIWSFWFIPKTEGEEATADAKWKRLDIPGSAIIFFAILLLTLGLTFGASNGWTSPAFLAPLIISFFLFPAFFWWEARLGPGLALVEPSTWKYKNLTMWIVLVLYTQGWWTCNQVPIIEVYVYERGDSSIIAALRILPQGIMGLFFSFFLVKYPIIAAKARWSYTIGQLLGILGYVLFILAEGRTDVNYWKFSFVGGCIGTLGNSLSNTVIVVGVMSAVPSHQSGVAGAILQTATQMGNVVALAVQAGLLTVHPGGVNDFRNLRASWAFMITWGGLCILGFWTFYRPVALPTKGRAVMAH